MKTLRISNEYECYPTWEDDDGLENIDPRKLEIPTELASRIDEWDDRFQATYVPDDPASSGFVNEETKRTFIEDGKRLFHELANAVSGKYKVEYRALDGTRLS